MATYGDNTLKQRIYDDLCSAQYGYVMDGPDGYIPAPDHTPEQVLVAALQVLADMAYNIKENNDE